MTSLIEDTQLMTLSPSLSACQTLTGKGSGPHIPKSIPFLTLWSVDYPDTPARGHSPPGLMLDQLKYFVTQLMEICPLLYSPESFIFPTHCLSDSKTEKEPSHTITGVIVFSSYKMILSSAWAL